jgi:GNAT superfamily N-acetyltransferase
MLRRLARDELALIWTIDRREVIDQIYTLENGELVCHPEHYDIKGWQRSTVAEATPQFYACYDRGGEFWGLFDGPQLVGVAVLDGRRIRPEADTLQLSFLHVSHGYRDRGLGRRLFEHAAARARARGARRMYVSATPSAHTVTFYRSMGCVVTHDPDPALYAQEPDDIHFEYML